MARPRRFFKYCIPVLLSWLCAMESGCQCSFSCAPTFKGPNCGPNGYGGGCGYGGPNCGPAGSGQWAQTGRDASQQPGQWGQGCNAPAFGGGYAQAPAYPVMQQNYQPAMQPQQQQAPVQLGPTPMPERAPDRMPPAQSNNMMVPYPGTLTNGQYMQNGSNQMPFSQGVQGVPFGPGPTMQQGNPNMPGPGPTSRPGRQGDGNENTLPAPRIMPTEAPYGP